MTRFLYGALALACLCLTLSPAFAAEVATKGGDVVVLPYGDWITAIGQTITAALLPVLTGYMIKSLYQVAPWAKMFLSDKLIESTVQKWLDYGLNSVAGSVKGGHLDISTGSSVIAEGLRRAMARADVSKFAAKMMKAAGGEAEVARKMFRMLHLDEHGTAADVLDPILKQIEAGTFWKPVGGKPIVMARHI